MRRLGSYGKIGIVAARCLMCIAAAAALTACNRYEYRKIECPRVPSAQSAVAWTTTAAHRGALRVRVVTIGWTSFVGIAQGVAVQLLPDPAVHGLDLNGEITFPDVPAGARTLFVRAIGYAPARGSVRIPADSGVDALVTLAEEVVTINEICGSKIRVRKPWWKF
jgi:hypothetical protein